MSCAALWILLGQSEKMNFTFSPRLSIKIALTASRKQSPLVDLWADTLNVHPVNPRKVWSAWNLPLNWLTFFWPIRANRVLDVLPWVITSSLPAAAAFYFTLLIFALNALCAVMSRTMPFQNPWFLGSKAGVSLVVAKWRYSASTEVSTLASFVKIMDKKDLQSGMCSRYP